MLYDLEWLKPGQPFPPKSEQERINDIEHNTELFDLGAFKEFENTALKLIGNFDEYFNFPILLGYQRLISTKVADMVCGAVPSITVKDPKQSDKIQDVRDLTSFDEKLYSAVIDYSRFGVTVFKLFTSEETGSGDFACINPKYWFPILKKDVTNRIDKHVIAWVETVDNDKQELHAQIHPITGEYYEEKIFEFDGTLIGAQKTVEKVSITGHGCLVQYAANMPTTTNIYGTSDYKIINTLVIKATERLRQILSILDRHADPSMVGPDTLLETDPETGEVYLKTKQFYAIGADEMKPEYLTWNGQLESAFKSLEFLLQQIYILSEMGEAFLGNTGSGSGTGRAISGTAMRFKMAAPLIKARRVTNTLTLPVKKLISELLKFDNIVMKYQDISIKWEDSLPKDPREQTELIKLQTGAKQIIPLKNALMELFDLSSEDVDTWLDDIEKDQERFKPEDNDINPLKKGSNQSLTSGDEGSTGTKSRKDKEVN